MNTGHISNDTGFAIGAGEYPAGGVAGILGVADTYGQIVVDSCYNTGTVSGGIIAGGILGGEAGSYSTKTTSNGSGNKELVVRNCYNAGTLDTAPPWTEWVPWRLSHCRPVPRCSLCPPGLRPHDHGLEEQPG